MQKLLTYLAFGATLLLAACSSAQQRPQYQSSVLEKLPFVYKMTVQQGNIVTEEMVDRLEPGMTKSQVRFLLGTPLLTDIFHTNRWDYHYTIRRGHKDMQQKRLTLFFQDDKLTQVRGDLRPDPKRAAEREPSDLLVSVPDWKDDRGILAKAAAKVGLEPAE